MGTWGWVGTIGGLIVGFGAGFGFGFWYGRYRLYAYSVTSVAYDCGQRLITVQLSGSDTPSHIYGHVVPGAVGQPDVPPVGAVVVPYSGTTCHVPDPGPGPAAWPGSGEYTCMVWGATFTRGHVTDTCGGSGSGAGSMIEELAARRDLHVAVPDGPWQGVYIAKWSPQSASWEFQVGEDRFGIVYDRAALVLRVGSSQLAAVPVKREPFSAAFPGKPFRAEGDVVVTAV